jgi:hypothetical protein
LSSASGTWSTLVAANLSAADPAASPTATEMVTWRLLGKLDVLMPRVEAPDETDWAHLLNQLESWARKPKLVAAAAVRDRVGAEIPVTSCDLQVFVDDAAEAISVQRLAWAVDAWGSGSARGR